MFMSDQTWEAKAKKLERQCLKQHGQSLTWISILNRLQPAIKEVWMGEGVIVDEQKYAQICQSILNEAPNL